MWGFWRTREAAISTHGTDVDTRALWFMAPSQCLTLHTQHESVSSCVLPVCNSVKKRQSFSVTLFIRPRGWLPHSSSTLWIVSWWWARAAPFLSILSALISVLTCKRVREPQVGNFSLSFDLRLNHVWVFHRFYSSLLHTNSFPLPFLWKQQVNEITKLGTLRRNVTRIPPQLRGTAQINTRHAASLWGRGRSDSEVAWCQWAGGQATGLKSGSLVLTSARHWLALCCCKLHSSSVFQLGNENLTI